MSEDRWVFYLDQFSDAHYSYFSYTSKSDDFDFFTVLFLVTYDNVDHTR